MKLVGLCIGSIEQYYIYRRSEQPIYRFFSRYRRSSLCVPQRPPPAGEGAPLEAPPEAKKLSSFASFPIKNSPKYAIKTGLVQRTKLSEHFGKTCFLIFNLAFPCRKTKWKPALASTDTYNVCYNVQPAKLSKNNDVDDEKKRTS